MPTSGWIALAVVLAILAGYFIRRVRIQRGSPPIPVQLEGSLRVVGVKPPDVLRRWARYASLHPYSRAYHEINKALTRLGHPADPADTPSERASSLIQLLPRIEVYIRDVLSAYHSITYSRGRQWLINAPLASKEIRNTSFKTLIRRIVNELFLDHVRAFSKRSISPTKQES
jgi:hypothetical protein